MLNREFRLSNRKDFDRIWKQGRAAYGSFLAIRFLKNMMPVSRFGIVVSLKVSKRSTKRNLLRRRIREALRKEFLSKLESHDIIILTKPQALTKSYQEIKEELGQLFRRARILRNHE